MFIERLFTNIKRKRSITLGPRTIIVGKNATGKSGIVTSLELALTGRCKEVGAIGHEIAGLSCDGSDINIEAVLSSGKRITFNVEGTISSARKPKWSESDPIGVFLADEITDILRSDPKKIRQSFIKALGQNLNTQDIEDSIPDALREDWDNICALATADGLSNVEVLIEASKLAKERAKGDKLAPDMKKCPLCGQDKPKNESAEKVVNKSDIYKALNRIAENYIAETLPILCNDFKKEISSLLGEDFVLELFDNDKPVCRFGIRRNGHITYWKSLSGAEKSRFIGAMACFWAKHKSEEIKIVVIDDVWLDANSLNMLINTLSKENSSITQAIICSVDSVNTSYPGWTVVNLTS